MTVQTSPGRRTRLTPEREQELYEAVLDLVREHGYDAVTMDRVAAQTKSSKATLYRQWDTKPKLVAAAMRHVKRMSHADIDTGTLAGDLREAVRRTACEAERDTDLMQALGAALVQNPDLQQAVHETIIEPDTAVLRDMVERAVRRGEVPPDNPAAEFLPHMLLGAVVARRLIDNRPPDDITYLDRYLEAVVFPALGLT